MSDLAFLKDIWQEVKTLRNRLGHLEHLEQATVDGATELATLGSVVQRLESEATGDNPTEDKLHGRAATTDATTTTVLTIPIAASNTYLIEVETIARRTGGSAGAADDGGIGEIKSGYKTLAGTVTLIATLTTNFQGTGTYNHALTISGSNVLVQVTGMVNHSVSWHVFVTLKKVGS